MLCPMVRLSVQVKAWAIVTMTASSQPFLSKFLRGESGVPELLQQLGPPPHPLTPTATLSFCQATSLHSYLGGKAAKGLLAGGGREELMDFSQTQTQFSATAARCLPLEGTRLLSLPEQTLAAMVLVRYPSFTEVYPTP